MLEETPEAYSVLTLNTSVGWIVRPLDEGRQRIVTPCNFVMQCRGSEAGVVFPYPYYSVKRETQSSTVVNIAISLVDSLHGF